MCYTYTILLMGWREGKWQDPNHTARHWQSQDLNPGLRVHFSSLYSMLRQWRSMPQIGKQGFPGPMTHFLSPSHCLTQRQVCSWRGGRPHPPSSGDAFLGGCFSHLSEYQVSTSVSPFGLHPRFVRCAFPFHELLHGIGVDYWTDGVPFVGPRILLFHCLLAPAESKRPSQSPHSEETGRLFHRLTPPTDSGHIYQTWAIWVTRLPSRLKREKKILHSN